MKRIIPVLLLGGAALLLGACSTINSRINEKGSVYYGLDEATRAKIDRGQIDVGFSPDMVYIALGRPDEKRDRVTADGRTEIWSYNSYYDRYQGSVHTGYRRWVVPTRLGYRVYHEPVYSDLYSEHREERIRVTFQDGKVATIEQTKS